MAGWPREIRGGGGVGDGFISATRLAGAGGSAFSNAIRLDVFRSGGGRDSESGMEATGGGGGGGPGRGTGTPYCSGMTTAIGLRMPAIDARSA